MYSYRDIRENFELISERLKLRGVDVSILQEIKTLDEELRSIETKINELNKKRNVWIKENAIGHKEDIKNLKKELSELEKQSNELSKRGSLLLHSIPNTPHNSLTANSEVIREWGKKREFKFESKTYYEIAKQNKLIDLESASVISGSGFSIYTELGASLFRALIKFTLDCNISKGYSERWLPVVVNAETLTGTAQLPKFEEDLFKVSDDKYLSPTSETQLVNLYRNRIIASENLPLKLTANTNCFRREAGSAGVDSSGIIRLHQFCKTEIVVFCKPEESFKYLEQMVLDASDILERLNLPYRVLQLAWDDMGFTASKTYDIEVWFSSEKRYREISSVSNTLDFQAKRARIRYKDNLLSKDEKTKYPHILNGSSLAIDRLFAALIDNYQNEDGSITVPEALYPYLNIKEIKL